MRLALNEDHRARPRKRRARGRLSSRRPDQGGAAAPALAGKDVLSGKRVSLADYAGRPVVINRCTALRRRHPQAAVVWLPDAA